MAGQDNSGGIDDAALAFDAAMGNAPARGRSTDVEDDGPAERLLGGVGDLENPDEPAGGDDLPMEGVPAERRNRRVAARSSTRRANGGDDEDPDADLYSDDEEEENPENDEGEEGEEEEDADEEEGDEGDEEDEEEGGSLLTIPDDARIRIKVDGVMTTVSGKEAREGIIRVKTLSQRLEKVNEGRQLIVQEAQKLTEDRTNALALIDQLGDSIKALIPTEPDWDKLYADNPQRARQMQKDFEGLKSTLNNLAVQRQKVIADAQADHERRTIQYALSEREKFEASNPVWATDTKRKEKDLKAMVRTGLSAGFTPEELDTAYDSRVLSILLKASKYDRMVASRPKPVRNGKNPVNPGGGTRRSGGTSPRGVSRAARQLERTGSVESAAGVFHSIINQR